MSDVFDAVNEPFVMCDFSKLKPAKADASCPAGERLTVTVPLTFGPENGGPPSTGGTPPLSVGPPPSAPAEPLEGPVDVDIDVDAPLESLDEADDPTPDESLAPLDDGLDTLEDESVEAADDPPCDPNDDAADDVPPRDDVEDAPDPPPSVDPEEEGEPPEDCPPQPSAAAYTHASTVEDEIRSRDISSMGTACTLN